MSTTTITRIRGKKPLRVVRDVGLPMMAILCVIFVPWLWLSDEPAPIKIVVIVLFLAVCMILTLLLAVASALSAASVNDRELRFTFCGLTTRRIPRRSIIGFAPLWRSRRSSFLQIFYGKRWYMPNGLFDHGELASLLESLGFSQVNADALLALTPLLDEDPGLADLADLAELVQHTPTTRYFDCLCRQLAAGLFTSETLTDSDPLPRPTGFRDAELPSFNHVHQRLCRISQIGCDRPTSPLELMIDGVGWDLYWTFEEAAGGRRLHLSMRRRGT